ncbi:hypothetical protein B0H10DRAFT_1970500 [Mycena sp. CBHHK59/15]|nr:hypothetical protein B0H10DRAFT_1970500 [Mycena sp. CBHHK59/15]
MHVALRLGWLDVLPLAVQRMAVAAARGSTEDFQRVYDLMDKVSDENRDALLVFLPVFYANLDSAEIPSGEQLDNPSTITAGAVPRGVLSLKAVYSITIHPRLLFKNSACGGPSTMNTLSTWSSASYSFWKFLPRSPRFESRPHFFFSMGRQQYLLDFKPRRILQTWAEIPPDLASIKLTRLVTELAALCDTASAPASSDLPAAAAKNLRSTPDGTVTGEDSDKDDDYEEARIIHV